MFQLQNGPRMARWLLIERGLRFRRAINIWVIFKWLLLLKLVAWTSWQNYWTNFFRKYRNMLQEKILLLLLNEEDKCLVTSNKMELHLIRPPRVSAFRSVIFGSLDWLAWSSGVASQILRSSSVDLWEILKAMRYQVKIRDINYLEKGITNVITSRISTVYGNYGPPCMRSFTTIRLLLLLFKLLIT